MGCLSRVCLGELGAVFGLGTREDLVEVYAIHAQGRARVIHEVRKLDEVYDFFQEADESSIKARIVFDMR